MFSLDGWQTNQIEAAMNNQSNCRFQSYLLMSAKLALGRWQRKHYPFALFHSGIETIIQYI